MRICAFRSGLILLACTAAAPALAVDVSAELGAVSDYRYRGYSLSDGKPAAQASIAVEHESGAYASAWASTIEEPEFDSDVEIDLTGGYALEVGGSLSLDLSATYYVYPSESGSNYAEATVAIERSKGPATLRAGYSFVPGQRGTRDDDGQKRRNSYLFAGVSYELPKLPLTLSAEIGHERGFFDEVENGGKWDWCLSGSFALEKFRLGLAYSGTDVGRDAVVASLFVDL